MRVYLCGTWDGTNLWLQWEDAAPDQGYGIRIRLRKNEAAEWQPWQPVANLGPYLRNWIVVPTWRDGWMVEAEVTVAGTEGWVRAEEVTFLRSRCRFDISTTRRPLRFSKGDEFHGIVDAAGCHYALQEDLWLAPGESREVELVASVESGYCQIDRAGDFEMRPALGVVIRNTAPSEMDILETGRAFTVLRPLPKRSPVKIVFGGVNHFSGARSA